MAIEIKSVISFGMVIIPIQMYTATHDNDIHFNLLHKDHHSRIKNKRVCAHCGDEVEAADLVKGYQYDNDNYVIITDKELEKLKPEKNFIEILSFVKWQDISPVYYGKTYQAIPQFGGEKAFEVLRAAMMEEGKIAVGKSVLGIKENLISLIPQKDNIFISMMYLAKEIKSFPKKYEKPIVSRKDVEMGKTLINSIDNAFSPEGFADQYQIKLRELIANKIQKKDIVAV